MFVQSWLFKDYYYGKKIGEYKVFLRLVVRAADMSEQYDIVNVSKYQASIKYNITIQNLLNKPFIPFINLRKKNCNDSEGCMQKIYIPQDCSRPFDEYETLHSDVYHLCKLTCEQLSSWFIFTQLKDISTVMYFRQFFLSYCLDSVARTVNKNFLTKDNITNDNHISFRLENSVNFLVILPFICYNFLLDSYETKEKNKTKQDNWNTFFSISFISWFFSECLCGYPRRDLNFSKIGQQLLFECNRLKKQKLFIPINKNNNNNSEDEEKEYKEITSNGLHYPTISSMQHLLYDLWKTNGSHFSSCNNEEFLISILNKSKVHSSTFTQSIMNNMTAYIVDRYRLTAFLEGMPINKDFKFDLNDPHYVCPGVYRNLAGINYDKISLFIHELNLNKVYKYINRTNIKFEQTYFQINNYKIPLDTFTCDKNEQFIIGSSYKKMELVIKFRKILLTSDCFIRLNIKTPQQVAEFSQVIHKVLAIVKIQTNRNVYNGVVVFNNNNVTKAKAAFLRISVNYKKFKFVEQENIQSLVRCVHCCRFEPIFYTKLYSNKQLSPNPELPRCVFEEKDMSIKHNSLNSCYWICPFDNACQPLIYNWMSYYKPQNFRNVL